jgi:hypothetical protein
MAYNPVLANRLRELLAAKRGITEREMFGGIAFLSRGYMFVGIVGDTLMARVGPAYYDKALARKHVRVMDFTGKPMQGYVFVDPPGLKTNSALQDWTLRCYDFVQTLPPKKKKT